MLRQLLLVLALVFGVVLFTGCERDGANGTTDQDGLYEQDTGFDDDDTLPAPTDNGAADDIDIERGTRDRQDTTLDTSPARPTEPMQPNGETADPNAM